MKNLPVEIKLKILKYFDFDDLFSLKQTNRHFRNLIFKYEDDLARKKHRSLSIIECQEYMPNSVIIDLPLTSQFLDKVKRFADYECTGLTYKKWKSAIARQIPLYLIINEKYSPLNKKIALSVDTFGELFNLHLPLFPKSIEYLKIIRYWLKKIVRCVFNLINFTNCVFNPEIIELLFDREEIQKFKFCGETIKIFCQNTNLFKFTFGYLEINKNIYLICNGYDNMREFNILLNILLNEGNKIPQVYINRPNKYFVALCNQLLEHIETSKDCPKMVPNIVFNSTEWPNLNIRGIEKNSNTRTNFSIIKEYEITNIHNSNLKFSLRIQVFTSRRLNAIREVIIKRIIN
uniref:F-box domain-containing protein n=1 Tax=Meloidogyne enterolobii TaxID=390850 RepID=A0A6V7XK63_MELEN|nr:unnamed protein product [Meloidogyne enterolobii]